MQAGYLTYTAKEGTETHDRLYEVFIPNMEARHTWKTQILSNMGLRPYSDFIDIFENIADTEKFSRRLTNFISMRLSCFDTDSGELERTYHVFIFGMMLVLGYKCTSNLEAGFGRYDILVEAEKFCAIMEFKQSKSLKALGKDTRVALKQIDDRHYHSAVLERKLPVYKIGIACYKKACMVKTVLHGI